MFKCIRVNYMDERVNEDNEVKGLSTSKSNKE